MSDSSSAYRIEDWTHERLVQFLEERYGFTRGDVQVGMRIFSGEGAPDSALGDAGDFYLDRAALELYGPKHGGTWPTDGQLVAPRMGNPRGEWEAELVYAQGDLSWTANQETGASNLWIAKTQSQGAWPDSSPESWASVFGATGPGMIGTRVAPLDDSGRVPPENSRVASVAGRTGAIELSEADILGLPGDLAAGEKLANKGRANGYPGLDGNANVPARHLGNVPTAPVSSVNAKTGQVLIGVADIPTLQSALDAKENLASKGHPGGYPALDGAGQVPASQLANVPPAPVQSVNGATGAVELATADIPGLDPALASKVDAAAVGQPGGVASLDLTGHISQEQIPLLYERKFVVGSEAEQLAVSEASEGDLCYRADLAPNDWIFVRNAASTGTLADWTLIASDPTAVHTVNGKPGPAVSLAESDIPGLTGALAAKIESSQVGQANGIAPLDSTQLVPAANSRVSSVAGKTGDVTIAESDVTGLVSDLGAKLNSAQVAQPGGVCELDGLGQVPKSRLANVPGINGPVQLNGWVGGVAPGATATGNFLLAKVCTILKVASTSPARLRLYASAAQRDADLSRAVSADPSGNHGLMLELVSTAAVPAWDLAPAVCCYSDELSPVSSVPYAVTNNDSAIRDITFTFTIFSQEA